MVAIVWEKIIIILRNLIKINSLKMVFIYMIKAKNEYFKLKRGYIIVENKLENKYGKLYLPLITIINTWV